MSNEQSQRERAGEILRRYGDEIPSSLRGPLCAVRDGIEVEGTLEGIMEFVDQWLGHKGNAS